MKGMSCLISWALVFSSVLDYGTSTLAEYRSPPAFVPTLGPPPFGRVVTHFTHTWVCILVPPYRIWSILFTFHYIMGGYVLGNIPDEQIEAIAAGAISPRLGYFLGPFIIG
jgi:hypothetical protein